MSEPKVVCGACQKPAAGAVVILHPDGRYSHLERADGWGTCTIQGGNIAAYCSRQCALKILEENKIPAPRPSKIPAGWHVVPKDPS